MRNHMRALKHLVGCVGLAIVLDYLLFNGFCTQASGAVLSHASSQILANLGELKSISPDQFIHKFF
jgi:hypothetical protein